MCENEQPINAAVSDPLQPPDSRQASTQRGSLQEHGREAAFKLHIHRWSADAKPSSLHAHKNTSGLPPVMSAPTFPQEICDVIIDALHADPRALAACSSVSRAWLSSARVHKFHTVRLRSPADCARLARLLDAPLLDSACIAHCVRDAWFGVDSHDTSVGDPAFQQMWRDGQRVAQLLLRFARISSLQLENVIWAEYWLPRGAADAFLAIAPRLAYLHLNRVVFKASDGVIRLLSACSTLRRLRMSYVSWNHRSRTVAEAEAAQRCSARMNLKLERITMEPWSYSALFSAAALYTRPVYVSADTVEWITSERPRNVVFRNLRAAEAIDVYRRIQSPMIGADDGMVSPIPTFPR